MAQKSISSNLELAAKIRKRRNELNLTIEEAAKRAGVGTKTWCRYEAGEAIRQDKYKGLCKALNWMQLPIEDDREIKFDLEDYRKHEAWSKYLEDTFGEVSALSFAIGSDILLDYIKDDLNELSKLPKGTHIGQLGASFLEGIMPEQFLMDYDYEFLCAMKSELIHLRKIAKFGSEIIAHSVLDELILVLVADESEFLIKTNPNLELDNCWKDWVYDIFDDDDIIMYLYSDTFLPENDGYHFSHWLEQQFYCDK